MLLLFWWSHEVNVTGGPCFCGSEILYQTRGNIFRLWLCLSSEFSLNLPTSVPPQNLCWLLGKPASGQWSHPVQRISIDDQPTVTTLLPLLFLTHMCYQVLRHTPTTTITPMVPSVRQPSSSLLPFNPGLQTALSVQTMESLLPKGGYYEGCSPGAAEVILTL